MEDDRDQAMLFAQVLGMSGYSVTTVATAEEAQTCMAETPYALLLVMQLVLPEHHAAARRLLEQHLKIRLNEDVVVHD